MVLACSGCNASNKNYQKYGLMFLKEEENCYKMVAILHFAFKYNYNLGLIIVAVNLKITLLLDPHHLPPTSVSKSPEQFLNIEIGGRGAEALRGLNAWKIEHYCHLFRPRL